MTTSRNDPCPCGSGRKYKKCCLAQDEKSKAEQFIRQKNEKQTTIQAFNEWDDNLDELSNQVVDLINSEQWDEAQMLCQRLREEFPEELDADDRLAQLYVKQKNYAQALPFAMAALDKARGNPEKFDHELVVALSEQVDFINEKINP